VVRIAIEELKRYKFLGVDQIVAEVIQTRGETVRFETHKLASSFVVRKNCLSGWGESVNISYL